MNKKLWDGRFTKATKNEVDEFGASIFFDKELGHEDLLGSLAHVQMLFHVGVLTEEELEKIKQGLQQIRKRFDQGKISFCSADEDIHMKLEAELKKLIGPLAGKIPYS